MLSRQVEQVEFIDHTMNFVGSVLGSDRVAFYQVDDGQRLVEFRLRNIDWDFHEAYLQGMCAYDPLHVTRLCDTDRSEKMFRLHDQEGCLASSDVAKYRSFLSVFDISDVLELLFRCDGLVVAGASVLCGKLTQFEQFQDILPAVHSYIEFNLIKNIRKSDRYVKISLGSTYSLTRREIEVTELACCGRTNAEIAECLGVGIATIKTHLLKIYQKLGVENRASLVALTSRLR